MMYILNVTMHFCLTWVESQLHTASSLLLHALATVAGIVCRNENLGVLHMIIFCGSGQIETYAKMQLLFSQTILDQRKTVSL